MDVAPRQAATIVTPFAGVGAVGSTPAGLDACATKEPTSSRSPTSGHQRLRCSAALRSSAAHLALGCSSLSLLRTTTSLPSHIAQRSHPQIPPSIGPRPPGGGHPKPENGHRCVLTQALSNVRFGRSLEVVGAVDERPIRPLLAVGQHHRQPPPVGEAKGRTPCLKWEIACSRRQRRHRGGPHSHANPSSGRAAERSPDSEAANNPLAGRGLTNENAL